MGSIACRSWRRAFAVLVVVAGTAGCGLPEAPDSAGTETILGPTAAGLATGQDQLSADDPQQGAAQQVEQPPGTAEGQLAPPSTQGVCGAGHWEQRDIGWGCNTCNGYPMEKIEHYKRWCWDGVGCGGCEAWQYQYYYCMPGC